jgi:hypothetical protein
MTDAGSRSSLGLNGYVRTDNCQRRLIYIKCDEHLHAMARFD